MLVCREGVSRTFWRSNVRTTVLSLAFPTSSLKSSAIFFLRSSFFFQSFYISSLSPAGKARLLRRVLKKSQLLHVSEWGFLKFKLKSLFKISRKIAADTAFMFSDSHFSWYEYILHISAIFRSICRYFFREDEWP